MNKRAFTLIELLAVIVIIAIIALIGIPAVNKIIDKSRINSLKNTAIGIKKAAQLYVNSNEISIGGMGTVDPSDPFSGYSFTLDMAKDGEYASLLDSSKDPWGKDLKRAVAGLYRVEDELYIDVIIELISDEIYIYKTNPETFTKFTPPVAPPPPPEPIYSTDITAVLNSSNQTPAASSSQLDNNYRAFYAFDHTVTGLNGWISSGKTGWLSYNLGSGQIAKRYAITALNQGTGYTPKSWTFEGSNDGSTWTVLDIQTDITEWHTTANATTAIRKQFEVNNSNSYSRYRVNITATNESWYVGIGELEIYTITN